MITLIKLFNHLISSFSVLTNDIDKKIHLLDIIDSFTSIIVKNFNKDISDYNNVRLEILEAMMINVDNNSEYSKYDKIKVSFNENFKQKSGDSDP